ncbi:hypothetical protein ACKWTF_012611 [Chironomus riparius]
MGKINKMSIFAENFPKVIQRIALKRNFISVSESNLIPGLNPGSTISNTLIPGNIFTETSNLHFDTLIRSKTSMVLRSLIENHQNKIKMQSYHCAIKITLFCGLMSNIRSIFMYIFKQRELSLTGYLNGIFFFNSINSNIKNSSSKNILKQETTNS